MQPDLRPPMRRPRLKLPSGELSCSYPCPWRQVRGLPLVRPVVGPVRPEVAVLGPLAASPLRGR
eukprot:13203815-Heterocapsa_arctica.AAC.1